MDARMTAGNQADSTDDAHGGISDGSARLADNEPVVAPTVEDTGTAQRVGAASASVDDLETIIERYIPDQPASYIESDTREHVPDGSQRDAPGDGHKLGVWRPSAAEAWRRIRDERPVVLVAGGMLDGVADALAAIGARPVASAVAEEGPGLLIACRAVILDAGSTLTGRWGQMSASARVRGWAPPVVLIASHVDRSPLRRNAARRLVAQARPSVIRGTTSELSTLVGLEEGFGSGHAGAASVAQVVAHRTGAVAIAWTEGEIATADARTMRSTTQIGRPAQIRLTAQVVDAAVAATLACGADPLWGARAAIGFVEAAVQRVAQREVGTGAFTAELLNILAGSMAAVRGRSHREPLDFSPLGSPAMVSAQAYVDGVPSPDVVSHPSVSAYSMADAVANRFEGGRVVPGSVPVHLLRHDTADEPSLQADRWARTSTIAVLADRPDPTVAGSHVSASMTRSIERATELGASAILLDIGGLSDASALGAVRQAVALTSPDSVAVAVRDRVDIAVAAGAAAVWLTDTQTSISVDAAVAVASGRVVVIASVCSLNEAKTAIGAGAGAVALVRGSGIDDATLADVAPVAVATSFVGEADIVHAGRGAEFAGQDQ